MKTIHRTLCVLLAIGVLGSSGCVYWRLFKFKRQLDGFSEHFAFTADSTYTLISLHPLLSESDVDGLMEVAPSDSGASWRSYAFAKDPPDGSAPLIYRLDFEDGLLTRIEFPAQLSRLYPGAVLGDLLESLGAAEVDRAEHAASAHLLRERIAEHLPDRATLREVLGAPVSLDSLPGREVVWGYRYRPLTTTQGKAERKRHAYGRFRFDAAGSLLGVEAGIGKHDLSFEFDEKAPAAPGKRGKR